MASSKESESKAKTLFQLDAYRLDLLTDKRFILDYKVEFDIGGDQKPFLTFGVSLDGKLLNQSIVHHYRGEDEQQAIKFEADVSRSFAELLPPHILLAVAAAFGAAYNRHGGNVQVDLRKKNNPTERSKIIAEGYGKSARKLARKQQQLPEKAGRVPKLTKTRFGTCVKKLKAKRETVSKKKIALHVGCTVSAVYKFLDKEELTLEEAIERYGE
jgi:hypothetical protein